MWYKLCIQSYWMSKDHYKKNISFDIFLSFGTQTSCRHTEQIRADAVYLLTDILILVFLTSQLMRSSCPQSSWHTEARSSVQFYKPLLQKFLGEITLAFSVTVAVIPVRARNISDVNSSSPSAFTSLSIALQLYCSTPFFFFFLNPAKVCTMMLRQETQRQRSQRFRWGRTPRFWDSKAGGQIDIQAVSKAGWQDRQTEKRQDTNTHLPESQ